MRHLKFDIPDNLAQLDDKELDKLDADLAKFRTEVRLAQNEVADERTVRQSVASFSPEQREAMTVAIRDSLAKQRKEREKN